MKTIKITNQLYEKLKAMADDQDELIEVVACMYLEQGMKMLPKLQEENEVLKSEINFNQAVNESNSTMRKH